MSVRVGITAYAAYVPYWRLERRAMAAALATGAARGRRAVASYDEDTTSMGVEAARLALRGRSINPDQLLFLHHGAGVRRQDQRDRSRSGAAAGSSRPRGRLRWGGPQRRCRAALPDWRRGSRDADAGRRSRTCGPACPAGADESAAATAAAAFVTAASARRADPRGAASARAAPPPSSSTAGACLARGLEGLGGAFRRARLRARWRTRRSPRPSRMPG